MALNNRIYKYTCNVCARSIERLADPTRPDPLRCLITDRCSGKLSLVSSRFGLRPNNTPTVVGLADRIQRGQARVTTAVSKPLDQISLASFSSTSGLTLAAVMTATSLTEKLYYVTSNGLPRVLKRTALSAAAPTDIELTAVLFELTPAALEYKQYTYVRTERAIYVEGRDDSAAQATLSFDNTSNVRVLVNGVLLDPTLYDKSVDGTITFTPQLEAISLLIEVFVYKSLTQFFDDSQAIRLTFAGLSPTATERTQCAWGDVASVGQYTPLFCSDISTLDTAKSYGLVRFEATDETAVSFTVDPVGAFLLAQPPYAFEDKRLSANVELSSLIDEGFPLSFAVNGETGETNAVIEGEALNPLLRPLTYEKQAVALTAQATSTVSLLAEHAEKAFILGPA